MPAMTLPPEVREQSKLGRLARAEAGMKACCPVFASYTARRRMLARGTPAALATKHRSCPPTTESSPTEEGTPPTLRRTSTAEPGRGDTEGVEAGVGVGLAEAEGWAEGVTVRVAMEGVADTVEEVDREGGLVRVPLPERDTEEHWEAVVVAHTEREGLVDGDGEEVWEVEGDRVRLGVRVGEGLMVREEHTDTVGLREMEGEVVPVLQGVGVTEYVGVMVVVTE